MTKEELELRIQKCQKCGLKLKPRCDTFKQGKSNLLIIGDSPSFESWIDTDKAFYTYGDKLQPTGRILNKLLKIVGLKLDDISYTECCKCYIEDRTTLNDCANNCHEYLLEQLNNSNENIILTMGKFATSQVLGIEIKRFKDVVGKVYNYNDKKVIPIYHCAPLHPLCYEGNIEIFENLKGQIKKTV